MSYEPTTWTTGDIITATKLNNIESGVQSVSSSYTPTTWATGDIITAEKLNKIEQGIANAGGGTSWQTVFEGSVTTTASDDHGRAIVAGYDLTANTIKVTFNGTEYTCEFNAETGYGAGDDGDGNYDWSEYPFNITPREGPEGGVLIISTESAGTYSVKIEAPSA